MRVVEAKALTAMDKSGTSDAYVACTLNGVKKHTETREKTCARAPPRARPPLLEDASRARGLALVPFPCDPFFGYPPEH